MSDAPRPVTLRSASIDEIGALQRVERDADSRFGEAADVIPEEHARRFIAAGRITVAVIDDAIVGWVLLGAIDGEPCVGQVSVLVAHGRRGIGTALLTHAIERARASGAASIVLNTQRTLAWNAPWYARHGFEVVAEEHWSPALRSVTESQERAGLDWSDRVHMRKRLGPTH